MIHIQCPEVWHPKTVEESRNSIFLAGGITGCGDWQAEMVELLSETNFILLNPRRDDFPDDPTAAEEETPWQVEWEFIHLRQTRARLFWFPPDTLCPITLFELGKYADKSDPLFVGVDESYKRKIDVEVQLRLSRPFDCFISPSIKHLANRIWAWGEEQKM